MGYTRRLPSRHMVHRHIARPRQPRVGSRSTRQTLSHMTTVSVIIPTFNNAARLPDCIRSVISQSGDFRLETIIVDDGSTDATPGITSEYQRT
ncbi:MAG: glycosyltransferase, partial [Muribaculaceae bacterium]|nr:glycosyltransferase [Muribaculaceae bacterium]